uniref:Transposase (Putative), gypsy type n=1 Tax=Tanacetum cinerariifolium TaxID=118510 RepID=A0A6L2KH80_TANCI|nr:hypothetical protein [Tanacetum cinerariifolium]
MVKDTIQLEDAVSTISQEYLLEFTSEYGIPESLHPEFPGPEEPIVEFSEGKVGVYTKFFEFVNFHIDLFSLISAPNPVKVKTGTRPHAAHKVPLLTAIANRVIDIEDTVRASESSGMPSTLEKLPLDFANEDPPQMITESGGAEGQVHDELAHGNLSVEDASQRGKEDTEANALPKVLKKDHAPFRPAQGTLGGESLGPVGLDTGSTVFMTATHDAPTSVVMGSQLMLRFEQEVRLLKKATAKIARRDWKIQAREEENKRLDQEIKSLRAMEAESNGLHNQTKNLKTLLAAEVDMKKAAKARNAKLAKELESLRVQFEKIKVAFEEFKRYEDDKVEQRCAEMDARLDKLRVDFDEELYPHMLTAIAWHRWFIGHNLRLAVMKCAESSELRQSFIDVVSIELSKGMSEGLKHGIEHGRASRDLADIKAYDPEADSKYVKALYDLKDLKEDYPQWIRELHPSSSQLKILVYPEVRDPKDPWSFKEEILLEDAIAANISRAEKNKKCRVVCHTYGIGSAHHARSDDVPVSVPIVAPQGLPSCWLMLLRK